MFCKKETAKKLQLRGMTLKDKESTKYLGVHIDKKLSFKTHIEKIKSKFKNNLLFLPIQKIDSERIL